MAAMSGPVSSQTESLNALAEDFLARYRRGERPTVDEYAARHAELAGAIRELFPTLVLMEELAPPVREPAGLAGTNLPRQLGEYRLVREIGRGGMGMVYEAVQESLGRRVAVKVLPPSLRQGKYRQRFEQEARAAARLHHTNIVPVFGVGEHDGLPHYVMQLIDGRGLDAILRDARAACGLGPATPPTTVPAPGLPAATSQSCHDAPGPPTEAAPPAEAFLPPVPGQLEGRYFRAVARLGLQAAEALAHAHAQGVLHRDVKPSNLLVDGQGTLWVADFGLAKSDDSADLTEKGDVLGTLGYMAPERFCGQADARADVYSLGATLYEMATLHPAFEEAERARLIERILAGAPPLGPRRWAPNLPPDLETIVLKAMAHDAADRYPTAEDLAEDLGRFLADQPILARRSSLFERLQRLRRRNPVVAWLTSAVVGLTLLLTLGSALAAAWLFSALSESEEARREQREHLWRALIEQARANRRSGRMGQRVESLRILEEAACLRATAQVRNEVIACLALTDLEEVTRTPANPLVEAVTWSVDSRHGRFACLDLTGGVVVRSLADGRILARFDSLGKGFAANGSFSPSGRYLVQHAKPLGSVRLWDLSRPEPEVVLTCSTGPTEWPVSFWGDERQVAIRQTTGSTTVYDLPSGRVVRRLALGPREQVAFHPRRPWLAKCSQKVLRVIDLDHNREVANVALPAPIELAPWAPEGERLAIACYDHRIYLWDVASWRILFTLDGPYDVGRELNFHPSGRVLSSFAWQGPVRLFDAAAGRQLLCGFRSLAPGREKTSPTARSCKGPSCAPTD
jgi:serine/threonine protein kinase